MATNTMSPAGMRKFGLIFAGFACLFIAVGAGMAWKQGRRLGNAVAVEATVLATRLDAQQDSDSGTTWAPVVEYSYSVNGREYRSSDVSPLTVHSSGRSGAEAVLQRFPVGARVKAWHDRDDPASAFLIREPSFFPYIFMLFPLIHVSAGLAIFLVGRNRERGAGPAGTASVWGTVALVWNLITAAAIGHFASVGGNGSDAMAGIGCGIAITIGVILALVWLGLRRKVDAALPADP